LQHCWGRDGPAPGYLAGGPNKFFGVNWVRPPYGEPPMKAYRDWNTAWNAERQANENSWEISEPAIYYQAVYTLLLSQFVSAG
jgi:endoglucanase